MPKNKIEPVKSETVIIPDTEKGGRLVNGELIGPTLKVKRYISKSGVRCDTLTEAREENLLADLNYEIHKTLEFVAGMIPVSDVRALIIRHGNKLKKVLQKKRYASLLTPAMKVQQEKETARDHIHAVLLDVP